MALFDLLETKAKDDAISFFRYDINKVKLHLITENAIKPFSHKDSCMSVYARYVPKFLGHTEGSQRANGLFPIYSHEEFPAQHACAFSRDTLTATVSSPSHSGYCPSCCLLTCSHLRTGMFALMNCLTLEIPMANTMQKLRPFF